jgi:LacI family transcriptional regulator
MTVIEIAAQAGVSIGTVDRVLHNRGRVSPETKSRIQKIIEKEGYQPNPLARHLKRNKDYRIGVLMPGLEKESRYWNQMYDGILKAAGELSAFSIKIELFEFIRPDSKSLALAFARMTASPCCAYIITPVMQEETRSLLKKEKSGVPYVLIDSSIPEADALSTVAQDPFRGGFLAGKMMGLISPSPGPFAVVRPFTEAFNLNERARGFKEWFALRPGVRIIDIVCPELETDKTDQLLGDALRQNPDLKGIFAVSSIGHKIVDVIDTSGKKKDIAIIGYDLVTENVQYLKDGKIDCLISQRPEEQGRHAVGQLYKKLVLEEEPTPKIDMPLDIYFKENLI